MVECSFIFSIKQLLLVLLKAPTGLYEVNIRLFYIKRLRSLVKFLMLKKWICTTAIREAAPKRHFEKMDIL